MRRVDEPIPCDLREIVVTVHHAAQQRVLQLLGAPHRRQRRALARKHLFAERGDGEDVEQRSVCVEGERLDGTGRDSGFGVRDSRILLTAVIVGSAAMNTRIFAVAIAGMLGCIWAPHIAAAAQPCESLTSVKLPDTTITAATLVQEGPFAPPAPPVPGARAGAPLPVPSFCRVQLTIAPQIRAEVWMPATGWNGKFEGVGGGGYAGVISYPALAAALRAGYATASTDTGHQGNTPEFALGHPELVIDFGYRGIHEMTVKGKQITEAFYGRAPQESYFVGCSTGGRQGLSEAQRYPDDYNGIVAGAPAIDWTHLLLSGVWVALSTLKDSDSYIPASKLPAINDGTLAACDMTDGMKGSEAVSRPRRQADSVSRVGR